MHESKISRAVCCKNCCKRCQKCQREIVQLENIQILSVTDATVRYTFWHFIFRTATTTFLQQRHHFILKSAIHFKKKGFQGLFQQKWNVTLITFYIEWPLSLLPSQSETLQINPLNTLIPATMCVSFGVMLPVGNPPNAIVFSYGHLKISDMVRHVYGHTKR